MTDPQAAADIYCRKSTVDRGQSMTGQENECSEDIQSEGWTVGRVFADPNRSASRYATKPRPDYDELVAQIAAGKVKILTLWEASRGSRDLGEWVEFLDLCHKHHVLIRITSDHRTYDVRKRRDYRTLAEDGIDARDESEKIAERVRRGKRALALDGKPAGPLLYGYARRYDDRGHYIEQVEHPDQAKIVREIAEAVATGTPVMAIRRDLRERGILSPRGMSEWATSQVIAACTNPAYIGQRVHQGEVVRDGKWPAILDRATFDSCARILEDPARRTQKDTRLLYFLSGAMTCGACGGIMRTSVLRAGIRGYACAACRCVTIKADPVDGLIAEMVVARLQDEDALAQAAPPTDDAALAAAEDEVADLQKRLDDHYVQSARGKLTAGGLAKVEAELLPMIRNAEATKRRLATPPALRDLAGVDVARSWGDFPVYKQRAITMAVCTIAVDPAVRGRTYFDRMRLRRSRWAGDEMTWGDHWSGLA